MSEWTIKSKAYKPELTAEQVASIVGSTVQQTATKIVLNNANLDAINLDTEYYQRHIDDYIKQWFFLKSGVEHYRLLVHIVSLLSKQSIIDLGTHKGGSAVALASNPDNQVYSFDIESQVSVDLSDIPNIHLIEANIEESPQYNPLLLSSAMIFLDTSPHHGIFETSVYKFLANNGYKGIIMFDDIHYGEGMQGFWASVTHQRFDLTRYGHHSGTGLILFNDTTLVDSQ